MSTTERPVAEEATALPGVQPEAPPASEDIHLPGPSIIPLACAVGITMVVVGTTIGWIWIGFGLAIFAVSTGLWIRDTIRDVDALPEEHHH